MNYVILFTVTVVLLRHSGQTAGAIAAQFQH